MQLIGALERLGVRPEIKPEPFGVPMKTPFPEDRDHASYQAQYVERFWDQKRPYFECFLLFTVAVAVLLGSERLPAASTARTV